MRRFFTSILILLMLCAPCYAQEPQPAPDGWVYMAYTYGGINFIVPVDTQLWDLSPSDRSMGIIMIGGNADFTIQLRQFSPEDISVDAFKDKLLKEPTAQVDVNEKDGSTIVCYQNTAASANSELFGIMLEGLDGNTYKISIFTGESEAFDSDAKVWEIAQIIADSVGLQDFSQWPI